MSIQRLVELVPPPPSPLASGPITLGVEVGRKYGVTFPNDYLELCRIYGNGGFVGRDGHEILLHNPFSHYFDKDVKDSRYAMTRFLEDPYASESLSEQGVQASRLFPLGQDTDDVLLQWSIAPRPEEWCIMFYHWEDGLFYKYRLTITEFLAGYFAGTLELPGWGKHIREGPYSFEGPEAR